MKTTRSLAAEIGTILSGTLLIIWAMHLGLQSDTGALLLNLGTNIIGIGITITFVDRMLSIRKNADEAEAMAHTILHHLDHVVWIWLGGYRNFSTTELFGLLSSVKDSDELHPNTRHGLVVLADRSSHFCKLRPAVVVANSSLKKAIDLLGQFCHLADRSTPWSAIAISQSLQEAAICLCKAVHEPITTLQYDNDIRLRDSSLRAQEDRLLGESIVRTNTVVSPIRRTEATTTNSSRSTLASRAGMIAPFERRPENKPRPVLAGFASKTLAEDQQGDDLVDSAVQNRQTSTDQVAQSDNKEE